MKQIFKRKLIVVCIILVLLGLSGCNSEKEELQVYGGDIVKNNTLMVNGNYLAYELPIISNQKITSFEIEDYNISGEGSYDIKYEKLSGGEKYNGWYYYFANLKVKVDNDVKADFSVDSVNINVNNQNIKYNISKMHFANTEGYWGEKYNTKKRDFVYDCEKTFLFQNIPKNDVQIITLEIQNDCTISEFNCLDFVSINNLAVKVNGNKTDFSDGISVKKGDKVSFEYTLDYKEKVSSMDLLKTTLYITYMDKDKEKLAFIDEQGLMIINYQNDNFVKEYIDNELAKKEQSK